MTQIEYIHDIAKMASGGLQLNLPSDLVPPSKYMRFKNTVSRIEGEIECRDPINFLCNVGATPIHSLFRLNQFIAGVNGERLFGIGSQLYSAPLPAGNVPVLLTGGFSFDGTPLSIAAFRFDGDPQIWAIIANANGMMKRKAGYYQQLGLPAPTVGIISSTGGAGLLNGLYSWRYTYVNPITLSESNPSPVQMTGGSTATSLPTAFTNPEFGGNQPFANPAQAYNGNPAGSVATGTNSHRTFSCSWQGFAALPSTAVAVQLALDSECLIGSANDVIFKLSYSLDGGMTFNNIYNLFFDSGRVRTTDFITLPNGVDLTKLVVSAFFNRLGGPSVSATMTMFNIVVNITLAGGGSSSLSLSNQSAKLCVTPPIDPQETHIRLYRLGGLLADNYRFVSESVISALVQGACGPGTLEIDDNAPDSQIAANQILEIDNDMPVSSVQITNQPLSVIWGYLGRLLGAGDPARPESVYFSKVGNADEWPPENWVDVSNHGDQVMNGLTYNLSCFVFTRERMWILVPYLIQGATFTPAETSCRRGLKGKFAFCVGDKGIYFCYKDGIYITQGGAEQSIIDDSIRPLFPTLESPIGVSLNGIEAVDMTQENSLRMQFHNGEIWFFYAGLDTGNIQLLIYDERRNRWRAASHTPIADTVYSEPGTISSLLVGGSDGDVYLSASGKGQDTDGPIACEVQTGSYDQQKPLNLKEYATVAIDIDPGGASGGNPVTLSVYQDTNFGATAIPLVLLTGSGRQRIPVPLKDIYGRNVSFKFNWSNDGTIYPIIYQTDILYRVEPAALQHWELPPFSLGNQSWQFLRDCYVTLRSTSPVTFKIIPDNGPVQTFTIPSTSGDKQKFYIPFYPNKSKVTQFTMDSPTDFRLYQQECSLRVKSWITESGYQSVPLFGAEAMTVASPSVESQAL